MLIVDIDRLNIFKKVIVFDSFRKFYSHLFNDFHISDDYNCLFARSISDDKECAIFSFDKPNDKILNKYWNYKIYVYYLNVPAKNSSRIIKEKMRPKFIHDIVLKAKNNFSEISDNSFLSREFKRIENSNKEDIYFKYYNIDTIEQEILQKILNDGLISFSNPKTFNDPFDCDYYNIITAEKKNSLECYA